MGIQHRSIAPGSPWKNGHAKRLIDTLLRECVDHLIVFGESHYAACYNHACKPSGHTIGKDTSFHRPILIS